jgi:transcriptional regulator with XRE-family HTH domain/mannose-6-phosphate isomerase-like protein (cupin superfamily)
MSSSNASQPAGDSALEIGRRLGAHRLQRGVKVSELARGIGVSPSLISQIERGQTRPSVSTLFSLSEALEVPVDAFFRDNPADEAVASDTAPSGDGAAAAGDATEPAGGDRYLVRGGHRAVIDIEGGVRWERLTPTTLDGVDFLELVYQPRAESNPTLYRHPGMEMVLLLSGRLDIYVGFERYELSPGDSIQFSSSLPHRYVNPTDEVARGVTVILHEEHESPPSNGPPPEIQGRT